MPRIPSVVTSSIVYLFKSKEEAEAGTDSGGSGFLFALKSSARDGYHHVYVVTNRHVVEGTDAFPVVRANLFQPQKEFERTHVFNFSESDWILDPKNDLAVCPLPASFNMTELFQSVVTDDFVMTEQEFKERDIGPGDQVVYVGRFVGHGGKYENLPSVRFGNISMNPTPREPIVYDTDDATRRSQVGFLVEARSRSGYSGSPVFFIQQHVVNNQRAVIPSFDMRLLGVDWGHLPERIALRDPQGRLHGSKWYVEVHAGMMGVIPAWSLLEFISEAPSLVEQRKKDDEYYQTAPAPVSNDASKPQRNQGIYGSK